MANGLPELFCDDSITALDIFRNFKCKEVPLILQDFRVFEVYFLRPVIQLLLK